MKYTENYELELYETGDAAALTDGYNLAMVKIDEELKNHDDLLENHENRITDLEDRVQQVENDIDNLEERTSELENRVDTAENDIDKLEENVTIIQENITNIEENITTIEGNITNNTEDIDNLQERISSVESTINNHTSELAQIQTDLDAVEQKNTEQDTNINIISTAQTNLETNVDSLQTNVTNAVERISNLESIANTHTQQISVLQANVSDLTPKLLWQGMSIFDFNEGDNPYFLTAINLEENIANYRQFILYGWIVQNAGTIESPIYEFDFSNPITAVGFNTINSGMVNSKFGIFGSSALQLENNIVQNNLVGQINIYTNGDAYIAEIVSYYNSEYAELIQFGIGQIYGIYPLNPETETTESED